jgi:DNA polymerase-3 subunit delta
MVAVKSQFAHRFLAQPPKTTIGAILYGSDSAQISAYAETLAATWSAHAAGSQAPDVIKLHDADMSADPQRIAVELMTVPMFGSGKVVWLQSPPSAANSEIIAAVETGLRDVRLIVQAPDLKRTAKLVQVFEADANLAAIACYGEEERDVLAMMRREIAAEGYEIDADALSLLHARAGASQLVARAEIEKLISYAGDERRITAADVEAATGDQAEAGFDDVIETALNGQPDQALRNYDRLVSSGTSSVAVLTLLQMRLLRLHALRATVDAGQPALQAVKALRPPVFFKQQDSLARQVTNLRQPLLADMVALVFDAVRDTRLKPQIADQVAAQALLRVAAACEKNSRSSSRR